jgi:hypothetical protein
LEQEFLLLGLAAAAETEGDWDGVGGEADAGDHGLGFEGEAGGESNLAGLDDEVAEVGVKIEDFDFGRFCTVIGEAKVEAHGRFVFGHNARPRFGVATGPAATFGDFTSARSTAAAAFAAAAEAAAEATAAPAFPAATGRAVFAVGAGGEAGSAEENFGFDLAREEGGAGRHLGRGGRSGGTGFSRRRAAARGALVALAAGEGE